MLSLFQYATLSDLWIVVPALIATLASSAVTPVLTFLLGSIFNSLGDYASGAISKTVFMDHVLRCVAGMLSLGAGIVFTSWIMMSLWTAFGDRQAMRARQSLFAALLAKDMTWFDTHMDTMGHISIATGRNIEDLHRATSFSLMFFLHGGTTVVACFALALSHSWSLTLVSLAGIPVIVLIGMALAVPIKRAVERNKAAVTTAADSLHWSIRAIGTVKIFCAESRELARFTTYAESVYTTAVHMYNLLNLQEGMARTVMLLMFVQAFVYGAHLVRSHKASSGTVMTVFWCCIAIAENINMVTQQLVFVQKGLVAVNAIVQLAGTSANDSKSHRLSTIGLYPPPSLAKGYSISFHNVSFDYPSRQKLGNSVGDLSSGGSSAALRSLTLNIAPGRMTFIMGRSGCGKSTLAALLLRHYPVLSLGELSSAESSPTTLTESSSSSLAKPSSSSIQINGLPIQMLSDAWIRDHIFVVEQMPFLIDGSVYENVTLGHGRMTGIPETSAVSSALEEFCVSEFATLDTQTGPQGSKLSGGQKQRVSLVRARVTDAPIMIFDESLSALPDSMRKQLMLRIREYRKNKTTIIITHDASYITADDTLIIMDQGRVVEQGVYRQLMTSSWLEKLGLPTIAAGNLRKVQYDSTFAPAIRRRRRLTPVALTRPSSFRSSVVSVYSDVQWSNIAQAFGDTREAAEPSMAPEELVSVAVPARSAAAPQPSVLSILATVPDKFLLALGLLCIIIHAITNPLFSWAFSNLISATIPGQLANESSSVSTKWAIIVACIALADGLSTYGKTLLDIAAERWLHSLRLSTFDVALYQPMAWYDGPATVDSSSTSSLPNAKTTASAGVTDNTTVVDPSPGSSVSSSSLTSLLLHDTETARLVLTRFISGIAASVALVTCTVAWSLVIGWKLALVGMSLVPGFWLTARCYKAISDKWEEKYKVNIGKANSLISEAVMGIRSVKILHIETYFKNRLESIEDEELALKKAVFCGMAFGVSRIFTFVAQALLLYYGLKLTADLSYTIVQTLQVYTLLIFALVTMDQLITSIPQVADGFDVVSRIFDIAKRENSDKLRYYETSGDNEKSDRRDSMQTLTEEVPMQVVQFHRPLKSPASPSTQLPSIVFSAVSFSYVPKSPPVLKNLSFSVEPGQVVAIVGPSGCGKSTISKLLTGLYAPDSGSISVGGVKISEMSLFTLRKTVVPVSQMPLDFFPGSILENLVFGMERAPSLERVRVVCNDCGIDEFITTNLQLGYDTVLGSTHSLMSGGQLQRLGIARALLRKPKVLILDECTSALDAQSQQAVRSMINKYKQSMTILMITHQTEMLDVCDRKISMSL